MESRGIERDLITFMLSLCLSLCVEMEQFEGLGERTPATGGKIGDGGYYKMTKGFVDLSSDGGEQPFSVSGMVAKDQRTCSAG